MHMPLCFIQDKLADVFGQAICFAYLSAKCMVVNKQLTFRNKSDINIHNCLLRIERKTSITVYLSCWCYTRVTYES